MMSETRKIEPGYPGFLMQINGQVVPSAFDIAKDGLRILTEMIKCDNERWWKDLETGEPIDRNVGEVLCLIHSEISEALEGHRKDLMDDHLPQYKMFSVELADAIIRILDAAAHWAPDMPEALMAKLDYNRQREDHKEEARRLANGKKY